MSVSFKQYLIEEKPSRPTVSWDTMYDAAYTKMMNKLTKDMNNQLRGKTVVILFNDAKDRHTWKEKTVHVKKVEWHEHDVNGPIIIGFDGERYQSHPDHPIKILG